MIVLSLLNLIMLKQQLQQKLQQKLSPQQIQLIRLLELPAIELEERIKHELEDNPALEEGKEIADDFDPVSYTHLDVYKRQVPHPIGSRSSRWHT